LEWADGENPTVRFWRLPQIPPADRHIPVLGQLPPAQLPLGDALEPAPLEAIGFDARLRAGGHQKRVVLAIDVPVMVASCGRFGRTWVDHT